MPLDTKQLKEKKRNVANVAFAFESEDMENLSQDDLWILTELINLDDMDWDTLTANLEDEDTELREQLASLRPHLKNLKNKQIRAIGYKLSLDLSQSLEISPDFPLEIGLNFKAGDKSLTSYQDLEDTLWIGATVAAVVVDTMEKMEATLNLRYQRSCIGESFGQNLEELETAVRSIRRIYSAIGGTDGPGKAS